MADTMRLDKYLADMGMGTRAQVKEAIRNGRVQINGATVLKPEQKVSAAKDSVTFDGRTVGYVSMEYYMLSKPQGVVSATEDKRHPTVVGLIADRSRKDLFPVGRLDLDTEGLLLITNDGDLAHRLLSPKKHVDKTYFARCDGRVEPDFIRTFADGILLPDGLKCLPAKLEILKSGEGQSESGVVSEILLTIREGKFHQIKRMMEAVGCPVLYLKRLTMGPLVLDESLKPGEYRELTEQELELLKNL